MRQILVLVHGSALDVAWAQGSPRVGAIISAFYPGQEARPLPPPLAAVTWRGGWLAGCSS